MPRSLIRHQTGWSQQGASGAEGAGGPEPGAGPHNYYGGGPRAGGGACPSVRESGNSCKTSWVPLNLKIQEKSYKSRPSIFLSRYGVLRVRRKFRCGSGLHLTPIYGCDQRRTIRDLVSLVPGSSGTTQGSGGQGPLPGIPGDTIWRSLHPAEKGWEVKYYGGGACV